MAHYHKANILILYCTGSETVESDDISGYYWRSPWQPYGNQSMWSRVNKIYDKIINDGTTAGLVQGPSCSQDIYALKRFQNLINIRSNSAKEKTPPKSDADTNTMERALSKVHFPLTLIY